MIIEPKPEIVTCTYCKRAHEIAIYSTIPQRVNFCSHACCDAYYATRPSTF